MKKLPLGSSFTIFTFVESITSEQDDPTVSESNNIKNRTEDFFSNYTVSGQTQAAKVCQAITASKVI